MQKDDKLGIFVADPILNRVIVEMLPEVRGKVSELEKELERLGDLRNK